MTCFAVITDLELLQNPTLAKNLKWGNWNLAGVAGWKKIERIFRYPFGEIRFYR